MKYLLLLSFVMFSLSNLIAQEVTNILNIIPKPKSIVINEGSFKLTPDTKIYYDQNSKKVADYLVEVINPATGYDFKTQIWNGKVETNSIIFAYIFYQKCVGPVNDL